MVAFSLAVLAGGGLLLALMILPVIFLSRR